MSYVQSLEQAVARLTPEELATFRRWFAKFDSANWDSQIEADAAAGRLDPLVTEALDEYRSGEATEI